MASQMQRLVPLQRQMIAAETPSSQQPRPQTQSRAQEDQQQVDDQRSTQRLDAEARDAHRSATHDAGQEQTTDQPPSHAHQRARAATPKTNAADADALLAGLMQGASATPTDVPVVATTAATPVVAAAEIAATNGLQTATPLQTIQLSAQVRIITDPKKAPSPESLAAFAKSMGLDESAIQNLLGQQPEAAAAIAGAPTSTNAVALPTALLLPNVASPSADSAVATQLAAMNASVTTQPAMVASGAGLAAAATTLNTPTVPGLTTTDMAAIQQLQITVLPAAVMPVNPAVITPSTSVLSTIDMLSMRGTGVGEQEVSALLSRFSQEAGSDSTDDQQPSQGDGNNFGSFSQALTRNANSANAAPANAAQAAAPNMSEVYDQLSDKMATELATRMHKQLSDGEWKMKFGLRPSNLGGVEIQLEMKDGKLDAVFRADNPLTRDLLQNSSQRLRDALGNLGINAGQVQIGQGGGNASQNNSGHASKQPQVSDNPSSQINGTDGATSATKANNKVNASLLDLYA
jgi:flagellar hook-length control protein FliK